MPEFKAHLITGIAAGGAVAAWGVVTHTLGPVHAGAVAILGTLGGLLPDIDSDSGKPLALLFQMISVLVPVLLYPYIRPGMGQGVPYLLCYFTCSYLLINYGVMPMVKKATRHRGMMHSLPFAVVAGEAAFLLLLPSGRTTAIFGGLAVLAGSLAHLLLDELSSGFLPSVKGSAGRALKLRGATLSSTLFIYALLIGMGVAVSANLLPVLRPVFRSLPLL